MVGNFLSTTERIHNAFDLRIRGHKMGEHSAHKEEKIHKLCDGRPFDSDLLGIFISGTF